MSVLRTFFLLVVLAIFSLYPYFEGGESSEGLFVFHTLTLAALAIACLAFSGLWIPRFLKFFIPFGLVLLISSWFSDYKYAAFLKLWDYWIGAAWAILICTVVREHKQWFESARFWIFSAGALSTILAISIYNPGRFGRISASFLNANEYAAFALMLLCFGLFCLEQEVDRRKKICLGVLSVFLLVSVGSSLSRGIFLACLSVAFVAFFRRQPGRTIKIFLILLVFISGMFIALRYRSYDDPVKYYRFKIWKSSLKGVSEDPYLGVGLGMLEYRALTFNFPAETELGRYSRIARSADSQYVEILAETGSLGLLCFLFGWAALFLSLRKVPERYFYLRQAWLVISVVAIFSVPLQNTAVLFLFLFLITICVAANEQEAIHWEFERIGRILVPVSCFLVFVFGAYLPFRAHLEFNRAVQAKNNEKVNEHLASALRYNPYQPYYRFYFIRKLVDARPAWEPSRWLSLLSLLDQSIELNSQEFDFYVYKARIYRLLLEKEQNLQYYSAAVSCYQTALDHNPFNVFLRLEYASFLNRLDRSDLAEDEAKKILEAEPAYLNARLFLTDVLLTKNRTAEARKEYAAFLEYYEKYRQAANYSPSSYVRSLLHINRKQKERVEDLLKAV